MNDAELRELQAAPYRLLSDSDLRRVLDGPSLFVLDRALALMEVERREAAAVSPNVAWMSRN